MPYINIFLPYYKALRHEETLFVHGRNLYLASLLLGYTGFIYLPPTNNRPAWYTVSTLDE